MRKAEILKQRFFENWEHQILEVFSEYLKTNHDTKKQYTVLHCYINGSSFNIPLREFKDAMRTDNLTPILN